jgi:hypothetical protein
MNRAKIGGNRLGELFIISDELEEKLHPEARKVIHEWIADIQRQVQLDEINDDDLKYLTVVDIIKLKRILDVSVCLNKCVDIKDGDKLYDMYFGDILFCRGVISQLRRDLSFIGFDIVPTLMKIYMGRGAKAMEEQMRREKAAEAERREKEAKEEEEQRKKAEEEERQLEKAKEEQRRREEAAEAERREKEAEERWRTAYKELNVPADDASKYLNSEEHKKFADSIPGAVNAYLAKRESYVLDTRADDYSLWTNVIKNRRKKEERKTAAAVKAREFGHFLNIEINKLKSTLSPENISIKDHFVKQIGDPRYTGHTFTDLLSEEQKQYLDTTLNKIVGRELNKLVSDEFRQFVYWRYHYSYYLLPSVDGYMYEGVPCLNFCFDTFAVIRAEIWIKPVEKIFGDYTYYLPVSEGNGSHVPLKAPQFIGYYYLILNPSDLGDYIFWQSIPLVLLKALLSGETKPAGVTISAASDDMITYKIPIFEEEVNIPDDFASYLGSIGSIDGMINMGIMTEKIAIFAKNELSKLKVEHKASPLKDKVERKATKKAKAFRLFDEGKIPSDGEVKAIKIKPKTRYNYYQEWKKLLV